MSRLGKTEKIVIALAFIGLLVTATLLFFGNPEVTRVTYAKDTSLGFVKPKGKDVRVKGSSESNWSSVKLDASVYEKDKVFTGKSSTAQINFKSGQKINLEPNSLVVLDDRKKEIEINLNSGGGFLAELKKGVKLLVKRNGTTVEVNGDGSIVQMNSAENNEVKMVVLRGEAQIKTPSQKEVTKILPHTETKVTQKDFVTETLSYELLKPEPNDLLFDAGQAVVFRWKANSPVPEYTLEVSKDPLFVENVFSQNFSQSQGLMKIPAGSTYFWRVYAKGTGENSKGRSGVSSFTLDPVAPPQLLNPIREETVSNEALGFYWQDPSSSEDYIFELSKSEQFEKMVFTDKTKSTNVRVSNLRAGQYFWRVTSEHPSRKSLISSTGQLTMKENGRNLVAASFSNLIAAVNKPKEEVKIQPEHLERNMQEAKVTIPVMPSIPTEFIARPTLTAAATQIPEPVASTAEPLVIPKVEAPTPAIEFKAPQLSLSELNFELEGDNLDAESAVAPFVRQKLPTVVWGDLTDADKYEVELSKTADFTQVLVKEDTETANWIWQNPQSGSFFVRVTSVYNSSWGEKKMISAVAPMRIILQPPRMKNPKISGKMNSDANVFVPSAAVAIWKSHPLSTYSEVEYSDTASFTESKTLKLKKNEFRLPQFGTYYVRARSLNQNQWPISRYSQIQKIDFIQPVIKLRNIAAEAPTQIQAVEKVPEPVKESTSLVAKIKAQEKPKLEQPKLKLFAGTGMDYLSMSQQGQNSLESGSFARMSVPMIAIGGSYRLGKKSYLSLEYHDWPGQISTEGTVTVDQTKYDWTSFAAEYQYAFSETDQAVYKLVLGVQDHQVPFLSTDPSDTVNLLKNELMNLSVGVQGSYLAENSYEYEFLLRYQSTLSSKNLNGYDFKAKPGLMFDGSVGVAKRFRNGMKVGLYWAGQYQDYNYDFTRDGDVTSGKQTLLNSSVQVRFAWEYFGMFSLIPVAAIGGRRRFKKIADFLKAKFRGKSA